MHHVLRSRRLGSESRRQAEKRGGPGNGGVPEERRMNHDISMSELEIGKLRESGAGYRCAHVRMTLLPSPRKDAIGPKGGKIAATDAAPDNGDPTRSAADYMLE
jgi:hypothetical protein